ncbi:hypothetical protein CXF72_12495 [Psychromonas sp. MB-3u-54]|nr:hypothetical protein CXF72_12495 [Psychromonas sp. MB-3u-54]
MKIPEGYYAKINKLQKSITFQKSKMSFEGQLAPHIYRALTQFVLHPQLSPRSLTGIDTVCFAPLEIAYTKHITINIWATVGSVL